MSEQNRLQGQDSVQWKTWKKNVIDNLMPQVEQDIETLKAWAEIGMGRKLDERYSSADAKLGVIETDPKQFSLSNLNASLTVNKEELEKTIRALSMTLMVKASQVDPDLAQKVNELATSYSSKAKKEELQEVLGALKKIETELS